MRCAWAKRLSWCCLLCVACSGTSGPEVADGGTVDGRQVDGWPADATRGDGGPRDGTLEEAGHVVDARPSDLFNLGHDAGQAPDAGVEPIIGSNILRAFGSGVHGVKALAETSAGVFLGGVATRDFRFGPHQMPRTHGNTQGWVGRLLGNNALWLIPFESTGEASVDRMATDGDQLTICARFSGTLRLGGVNYRAAGSSSLLVVRIDKAGTIIWVKPFDSQTARFGGIAMDAKGDIYLGVTFGQTLTVGGQQFIAPNSKFDILLVKLARDGSVLWAHQYGQKWDDDVLGLAFRPPNAIHVSGEFYGTLALDGTSITAADSKRDVFYGQVDATSGRFVRASALKGGNDQYHRSMSVVVGVPYVAVLSTVGKLDYRGAPYTPSRPSAALIVELGSRGEPVQISELDPLGLSSLVELHSGNGTLYATGQYATTVYWDGITRTVPATAPKGNVPFIATRNSSGSSIVTLDRWSGDVTLDAATSDASGGLLVAGRFTDKLGAGGQLVATRQRNRSYLWRITP
ncbi:MAG: hypothetical protein H6707_04030 [Deltaproteobacteria bacterium]|nr:hypothetical protein [Deltaproteobacteria bacterium]